MRTNAHNTTPPAGPLPRRAALLLIRAGLLGSLLAGGCAEDFSAVLALTGTASYGSVAQCSFYTAQCRLGEVWVSPIGNGSNDPCTANYQEEFGDWLSCWDEIDDWFREGSLPKDVRDAVGGVPVRHPKTKVEISGEGKTGCSYPYDGEPTQLAFGESACCASGAQICHCDKTAGLTMSHCVSGNCVADSGGARCQAMKGDRCATYLKGKLQVDDCEPGTFCAGDGCLSLGRCQPATTPGLSETCPATKPSCIQNEGDPNAIWSLLGPLALILDAVGGVPVFFFCLDGRCHQEAHNDECVEMPAGLGSLVVGDL